MQKSEKQNFFALMVDESKDIRKSEQISIVVRYLKGDEVREEFLHFTHADGLDAGSLLGSIQQTPSHCNIDKNVCWTVL